MTTRDIEEALVELYGAKIPHTLISQVTEADAKSVAKALKRIYQSATADEPALELDAFEAEWGTKYKSVMRL